MTKLVLDDIGSTLTNTAATTINSNNDKIETALENTLSRDGTTPNQMNADIDMNSNDLLNVKQADVGTIILNGSMLIPGGSATIAPGSITETFLSTSVNTSLDLADTSLQPGDPDTDLNFLQAGTGATTRTTRNKNRDEINVLDFGAVGDGVANDAPAIQLAINFLKSLGSNTRPTLKFGSEGGARRNFKISSTLNFTQMRDVGLIVDFNGSVLIGATNGQPVIDALDSEHIEFRDGTIFGQNTLKASYGIQFGRGITGRGAAYMAMSRVNFTGDFTGACIINSASEICRFDKCNFWNSDATAGNACVIQDGRRVVHITSQFFTVTQPDDTIVSHNDNIFTNCTFEKIDGVGAGYALKLYGTTRAHHFINCYAQNQLGAAVYSSGDHTALELDLHCEAATIQNNIVIDAPNASTSLWRNCKIKEYYMFCTDALIKGITGTGNIFFSNSEISVQDAALNKKLFNKNGTTVRYHGDIYLGNSPSAALYDLSTLDALNGDVFGSLPASNIVPPSVGSWRFSDFNSTEQRMYGIQHVMGSFNLEPSGTNLTVSGGVLTIPRNSGTSFFVASGGNITSIAIDATADKGRLVQLFFGYSGTLTNSLAGAKTLLAGNYNFVANNSILLYSDGVKWSEVSRCLNVAA